jgi:hypothetical protein
MGQLAIVNAPSSFTFIWSFIKPWLSKDTVNKVDILGSDYQEVLLDLIDEENLPASLGGKCECEGGCEFSFAGPWKEKLAQRRERREREYGQGSEHLLSVNGLPSIDKTQGENQASMASPTGTLADEHIGIQNGGVVVPSSVSPVSSLS